MNEKLQNRKLRKCHETYWFYLKQDIGKLKVYDAKKKNGKFCAEKKNLVISQLHEHYKLNAKTGKREKQESKEVFSSVD